MFGPLSAFMSSVTWAAGTLAYSRLSQKYPAYIVNLYRVLFSLPFFFVWVLIAKQQDSLWPEFLNSTRVYWVILSVVSSFALADMLFLWATKRIGPASALTIASTYPLWAALIDIFVEGESIGPKKFLGVFAIVCGTILVIRSSMGASDEIQEAELKVSSPTHRFKMWGYFFAFVTSLFWALNAYSILRAVKGLEVPVANVLRYSIALILVPLIGFFSEGTQSFRLIKSMDLRAALFVFMIECFGGPFFYVYGLSHSSLAVGAALSSLAPSLTLVFGLIFKIEKLNFSKALGVLTVSLGIVLLVA